ncbi:MAG: hypothetical protein ACI92A_002449, partial [Candidatus Paceibacteria bacterium]
DSDSQFDLDTFLPHMDGSTDKTQVTISGHRAAYSTDIQMYFISR